MTPARAASWGAWGLPNVQDKRSPFNDDGTANYNDAWNKRSRFQLRVDSRSETELGTLRAYLAYNMEFATGTDDLTVTNPDTGTTSTINSSNTEFQQQHRACISRVGRLPGR